MKPNVGPVERYVRIGAGLAAIGAMFFVRPRWLTALLGAVAVSGIETGVSRYCPINEALGVDHARELEKSPLHRMAKGRSIAENPAYH